MEWASVLVIILHISKKEKNKTKQTKQPNKIQEKQRGRAAQQKITVQSKLTHCINRPENKLTIHLLDLYRHFPLNHEVRA